MKTENAFSAGQAKTGTKMRLLAQRFALKPVSFPLKVRPLRLGLGVGVGFCTLPGKKIVMGFASEKSFAPVAIAEGDAIRPLKKLKDLVRRVGEVNFKPDSHGGKIATVKDAFDNLIPIGQIKKEGAKWGIADIRIPLPKSSLNSLSWPEAASTLFMGVYLPCLLSGFPLCMPTGSVFCYFLNQSAGSAILNVLDDARTCRDFSLTSSGYETATALSIKESGIMKALKGALGSVSSSYEDGYWTFSSSDDSAEVPVKKFESFMNLACFAADSAPHPFGFWEFLDAMEGGLEHPLDHSPFNTVPRMAHFASFQAERLKKDALDPEGEWVLRSAFLSAASSLSLPLPIECSISFSSPPGRAALVLQVGGIGRIPEFLAPHPLGRRRLLFLFSLSVARILCAAAFGACERLEEVDLFISTRDFAQYSERPLLFAKGSFSRGEFMRPEGGEEAEEFFKARFKGDLARSPYFSPMPSEKVWTDPPFSSSSRRKPPEFSFESVPEKFASALGSSFVCDLSSDRRLSLMNAMGTFQSIAYRVRSGKMGKEEAEEKVASLCRLIPDPEIVRAGSDLSSFISSGTEGQIYSPRLEEDLSRLRREARRMARDEGRADEAVALLEKGAIEAEEEFDLDPAAPSRYFENYLERVVYNKFLSAKGEYTVLLPPSLFAIHMDLEEIFSHHKDPRALEHANWQVLHAPATPLAHLNQYKELSALRDWESARGAAMNMLQVAVEGSHIAMAYRNLGYCSWMQGDLHLASALYRVAEQMDKKEELIRTEKSLLESVARSSHILLPSVPESLYLLQKASVPLYTRLPGVKAARRAAEALVDCGLFLPALSVLSALSTLPRGSEEAKLASTLFC